MSNKSGFFTFLSGIVLLMVLLACGFFPQGLSPSQSDSIGTSAAQTLTAFPQYHPTSISPTQEIYQQSTPTILPLNPVISLTPTQVYVRVLVDTHCRKGPGQAYDAISALRVGQQAVVVGKYPPANYWIIESLDGSGLCWLWGQYASIEGDINQLPFMTPYPSPTSIPATPSTFTLNIQFYDIELCNQGWVLAFEIASPDVGPQGMHSAEAAVMDVTAGNIMLGSMSSNAPFCVHPCGPCDESCGGGAWTILSVPIGSDPHHGDQAAAKIIVCTQDNLKGACAVQDFSFSIR